MGLLSRFLSSHTPETWHAESRVLRLLGRVRPPEAVQWITTSACDLSCPHCYSEAGPRSVGELTAREASTLIVDELVALERPTLVLAGGEPCLRRDLPEVISYAGARGVPWAMHTHGGHIDRLQSVLERWPPSMAAVSVDGPRDYHDRFRGRSGSFAAAQRAIDVLVRAGCPEVVVGTTINAHNADLLATMLPDVLASRAHGWGWHLMTPEGRAGRNRALLARPEQLRRAAALARRLRSFVRVELDNEWGSAGADDCFYRDDPFVCGAGRFSCVVAADGSVMPCTTTDPSEAAGNVRERRLRDIWLDGFGAFRGGGDPLRSETRDCWLQTRHGHSCRGAAFPEATRTVGVEV